MKVSPTIYQMVRDWLADGSRVHLATCNNLRCLFEVWTHRSDALCPYCNSPLDWRNAVEYSSLEGLTVSPTSPTHVTADQLALAYDEGSDHLLVLAPSMDRPTAIHMTPDQGDYDQWLGALLTDIESGAWIQDEGNRMSVILALGPRNVFLLPLQYELYTRQVLTPEGVWVELELRLYPEDTLHEMTQDRALHINVAAKTDPRMAHRTHIAEVRTQLGEHQFELAYKLVDRLCDKLELGRLALETQRFLNLENLTPDDIELLLKEPIT